MEKDPKQRKRISVVIIDSRGEITDKFNIDAKSFRNKSEYREQIIYEVSMAIGQLAQREN